MKGNKHGSVTSIAVANISVARDRAVYGNKSRDKSDEASVEFFMETKVFSRKEKKDLTPKQQKVKNILNWVVNILCIVIIIFSLIVAIFTIVRSANGGIADFGGNCYLNVMSDSMEPTFSEKDVIIGKAYKGDGSDLKVGQVITFKITRVVNGKTQNTFNSHRIVEVKNQNGVYRFTTKGDNAVRADSNDVLAYNVVATWGSVDAEGNAHSGKIMKGVGGFANWLNDLEHGRTRFFCVIVLPLILLFVAYGFVLVRSLIIARYENNKQVVGEQSMSVDSLSDEEKRRLAQELLASLQADGAANAAQADAEETSEAETQTGAEAETTDDGVGADRKSVV